MKLDKVGQKVEEKKVKFDTVGVPEVTIKTWEIDDDAPDEINSAVMLTLPGTWKVGVVKPNEDGKTEIVLDRADRWYHSG